MIPRIGLALLALIVLAVAGLVVFGPRALRARYERDVRDGLAHAADTSLVTEAALAPLPAAVQRYLRLTGAPGRPRVANYRVRMRGRIRASAGSPWMPLDVEQTSFVSPAARLFFMRASRGGVPITGLHRYVGPHATMDVRLFGVFPVVYSAGPQMDQAETVTLFNDMCVLAPATLVDPAIRWQVVSPDTVRATFTNAGRTIRADLVFDEAGELVDFVSDDRFAGSPDGRSFELRRWTTPIGGYRAFGAHRLCSTAEARWDAPGGAFAYAEFEVTDVQYNVTAR